MGLRIAVVTDALSDRHFFPVWRRYYGGLFGEGNLFAVTYAGGTGFADHGLGGVVRLPVGYDDATRANVISDFVATLLGAYDVVVRVDADELLCVDPAVAPDLRTYLDSTAAPYVTARGFDVVQLPSEPPLGSGPLLAQRRVAYPNTALNKTAITRTPLHWTAGFHWCSAHPACGPVFLLHLKRVDIDWQVQWAAEMTRNIAGNPVVAQEIKDYYRPDRERIAAFHAAVAQRPRLPGMQDWYREALQARFLASVAYSPAQDIYAGRYEQEDVLCTLPPTWQALA